MQGLIKVLIVPSKRLLAYLLCLHLLALLVLQLYSPNVFLLIALSLLLLANGASCCYKYYFASALQALQYSDEGWQLSYSDSVVNVDLLACTLWPGLLTALYRCPLSRKNHKVVLFADSCGGEDFRRLRVLLKSGRGFKNNAQPKAL